MCAALRISAAGFFLSIVGRPFHASGEEGDVGVPCVFRKTTKEQFNKGSKNIPMGLKVWIHGVAGVSVFEQTNFSKPYRARAAEIEIMLLQLIKNSKRVSQECLDRFQATNAGRECFEGFTYSFISPMWKDLSAVKEEKKRKDEGKRCAVCEKKTGVLVCNGCKARTFCSSECRRSVVHVLTAV
jgi:hypothetical protein